MQLPPAFAARVGFRPWAAVRQAYATGGAHSVALAGQAAVSAVNFLTTVLVSRYSSAGQLGLYALGASMLIVLLQALDPLVNRPYIVHRFRHVEDKREFAGGALAMCGLFATTASALFLSAAVVMLIRGDASEHATFMLILGVTAPFWLLRGFVRGFALANIRLLQYLRQDLTMAGLQIGAVLAIAGLGRLTAATAICAIMLASATSGVGALWRFRAEFAVRPSSLTAQAGEAWALGKWLLIAQGAVSVQLYASQWFLTADVGVEAAGLYAAYMSVALIANPFVLGVANMLSATSAIVLNQQGPDGLKRYAAKNAVLLACGLGLFCLTIALFGAKVVGILYPDALYASHAEIVTLLAIGQLVGAVGLPASNALASLERPRRLAAVSLAAAATSALTAVALTSRCGLLGAALAFVAGSAVGSIGRWAAFLSPIASSDAEPSARARALPQLGGETEKAIRKVVDSISEMSGARLVAARSIGVGEQAEAFLVELDPPASGPTQRRSIVIKLFNANARLLPAVRRLRPDRSLDFEAVARQFVAASRLHATLDGRRAAGWTLFAPRPLVVTPAPLALASELVPGRRLDEALRSANGDPRALRDISAALLAAISFCWDSDFSHGDLTFDNILYQPPSASQPAQLSLIDPGTEEACAICAEHSSRLPPPIADLAHLSTDISAPLRRLLRRPLSTARKLARRRAFAGLILRSFLDAIASEGEREGALDAIRRCCGTHIDQAFARDHCALRPWVALRRWLASRQVQRLIRDCRSPQPDAATARGG